MQRSGGMEELALCKEMAAPELGDMGLLEPVRRSIAKYFKGHAVLLLLSTNTIWKQANK